MWAESKGYTFAKKGCGGKAGSEGAAPTAGNKKHPVTRVSWRDCIVWCNAYTEKTKGEAECVYRKNKTDTTVLKNAMDESACDGAYADMSKKGYRLPMEAEWEYAARLQGSEETNGEQYGDVWLTKLDSASGAKGNWKDTDKTKKVAWYGDNAGVTPKLSCRYSVWQHPEQQLQHSWLAAGLSPLMKNVLSKN